MDRLTFYYQEHADQARQHEDQRERMTNIALAIAGVLIGVITYSELVLWSLPAALAIAALGLYGLVFARKHYERNRYHVYILREIRKEMDYVSGVLARPEGIPEKRTLDQIREAGVRAHYNKFNTTSSEDATVAPNGSRRDDLEFLKSHSPFICRVRVHKMWEGFHRLIAVLGLCLSIAIVAKPFLPSNEREPLKVQLVHPVPVSQTQP